MTIDFRAILAFVTYVSAWSATVLGGMAVPVPFGGIVAIPLLALAIVGFILFGGLLRPEPSRSGGRTASGWLLIGVGGCLFVVAMFSIGAQFTGTGPQPPDIRRFANVGATMIDVLGDWQVVGFSIAGASIVAFGARLRSGGFVLPALLFVACTAAYLTVVAGLQVSC